jgi:carbonic anhydrase/acetyltransferase-like protein (isoleucine patch superfamily)
VAVAHVFPFGGNAPLVGRDVWLAPTATVIGNATLGDDASVWFGAVIRADTLAIVVGARSNVQDNAVVHVTSDRPLGENDARGVPIGTKIGDDVTIGHSAVVHACTVGDRVLVGIGAIVLDGAVVGDDVVIAAGALVTPGTKIPSGSMVMGRPAKVVRALNDHDRFWSQKAAELYVGYAKKFRGELG